MKTLEKLRISTDLLSKMKKSHENTINFVETNKGQSSWSETRSRVRQGTILSPILFNVTTDKICNKIREKIKETDLKAFKCNASGQSP
jgi:hypothetical protein